MPVRSSSIILRAIAHLQVLCRTRERVQLDLANGRATSTSQSDLSEKYVRIVFQISCSALINHHEILEANVEHT